MPRSKGWTVHRALRGNRRRTDVEVENAQGIPARLATPQTPELPQSRYSSNSPTTNFGNTYSWKDTSRDPNRQILAAELAALRAERRGRANCPTR